MAGKPQKPAHLLQGHRRRRETVALTVVEREPPPFPRTIEKPLASTVATWEALWRSRSASQWSPESDLPQIEHLMWCIDERTRARRAFSRRRLVEDRKGRVTLNPLGMHIGRMDRTIAQLAEKLALTPLDRMRLGLTIIETERGLRDLNDDLDEDDPDDGVIELEELG